MDMLIRKWKVFFNVWNFIKLVLSDLSRWTSDSKGERERVAKQSEAGIVNNSAVLKYLNFILCSGF